MTSRLARMAALAVAGILMATTPVHAGTGDDPTDVLGTWSFRTKPYRGGECLMTGTMNLTPHPEEGQYTCELTAVEVCTVWGRSVVRQSCKARRFGDQAGRAVTGGHAGRRCLRGAFRGAGLADDVCDDGGRSCPFAVAGADARAL